MTTRNLWGEFAESDVVPPVTMLREQATRLGEMTRNVLQGRVRQTHVIVQTTPTGSTMESILAYALDIVAPALDDYAYTVLQIQHGVSLYPVRIISHATDDVQDCDGEEQFVQALGAVLSSYQVRRIVASLLEQSKAIA